MALESAGLISEGFRGVWEWSFIPFQPGVDATLWESTSPTQAHHQTAVRGALTRRGRSAVDPSLGDSTLTAMGMMVATMFPVAPHVAVPPGEMWIVTLVDGGGGNDL